MLISTCSLCVMYNNWRSALLLNRTNTQTGSDRHCRSPSSGKGRAALVHGPTQRTLPAPKCATVAVYDSFSVPPCRSLLNSLSISLTAFHILKSLLHLYLSLSCPSSLSLLRPRYIFSSLLPLILSRLPRLSRYSESAGKPPPHRFPPL